MADLIPRALSALSADRASRELVRRVDDAHGDAVVAAARVEGAAFVASVGLSHAGQLASRAESLCHVAPAGARVYGQIVDGFGASVGTELMHLTYQGRMR